MKTKILVGILIIVIIACGVLLGMKFMQKNEETTQTDGEAEENSIWSVILNNTEEEEEESQYAGNERTIAVVIDNVGDARPQASLNDAMIVYEAYVEGGLTRLLAIYKNADVETIGPVRSARPVFIDYALENDSIFVHYGGSTKALQEVETYDIDNVNGISVPSGVFWRTSSKSAPHNALISTANIWSYANTQGYRTTTTQRNVLNYVTDEVTLEDGTSATTIDIPYSASKVKYVYNEETQLYERYVAGELATDWITGDTITTKNIIITFANNYTTDEENGYGRQAIENIGSIDGYYITNGKAVQIICEKTSRTSQTVYKDLDGNEIEVNDGNTYIQIVPPSMNLTIE